MTDAAFKATFEDFKLIKTRKVCQIVLEVPIEGADAALEALGGLPRPDQPMWVMVALAGRSEPKEKPKRSWDEIPLPEQIGIRIKEPQFQGFIAGYWDMPALNPESAATGTNARVKAHLMVRSKTEVLPGTNAARAWLRLDQEYQESFGLIAERTT